MKKKISRQFVIFMGVLMLSALMLAACTPALVPVTGDMPVNDPQVDVSETEVRLEVASNAVLGEFLVDGSGMTLYMFTMDAPNTSNCAGDCLAAWPPFILDGSIALGDGVDAGLVGQAELADGSMIVTYNQMPLYYWVGDVSPGDTNGQDVNMVWYVVSPAGHPIGIEQAMDEVLIKVLDHPEYGRILGDGNGRILYMFTNDGPNVSNCTGMCLDSWPPLLAVEDITVGEGVNDLLLGEALLEDGSLIVTYNGMPLYYWVGDMLPGDTNGQGINNVWFVVSADGMAVKEKMMEKDRESEKDKDKDYGYEYEY